MSDFEYLRNKAPKRLIRFFKTGYNLVTSEIHEELGWHPRISFEEGFHHNIDSHIEYIQWVQDILSRTDMDY